jgi:DNA-binding GntR family transcriptional regulator
MQSSLIIGLHAAMQAPLCEDDDHRRIVEAVARRDEPSVSALIDAHLRHIEGDIRFEREAPVTDLRAILA